MALHQVPLPVAMLGDIKPLGLELKDDRRVPVGAELAGRRFGTRFRCTRIGFVTLLNEERKKGCVP